MLKGLTAAHRILNYHALCHQPRNCKGHGHAMILIGQDLTPLRPPRMDGHRSIRPLTGNPQSCKILCNRIQSVTFLITDMTNMGNGDIIICKTADGRQCQCLIRKGGQIKGSALQSSRWRIHADTIRLLLRRASHLLQHM